MKRVMIAMVAGLISVAFAGAYAGEMEKKEATKKDEMKKDDSKKKKDKDEKK